MLKLKDERDTLTKVAEMLESGELKHSPDSERAGFNMGVTCSKYECGTVACIGGSAYLLEHPNQFEAATEYVNGCYVAHNEADLSSGRLEDLYWMTSLRDHSVSYRAITPQQAAIAIRKYLAGSPTLWDHVINEEEQD